MRAVQSYFKDALLWVKKYPERALSFFGKLFIMSLFILTINWITPTLNKLLIDVTLTLSTISVPLILFFAHKKGQKLESTEQ